MLAVELADKDSSSRWASGESADAGLGLHSQNYDNGQGSFGGCLLQDGYELDIDHGGVEPGRRELACRLKRRDKSSERKSCLHYTSRSSCSSCQEAMRSAERCDSSCHWNRINA